MWPHVIEVKVKFLAGYLFIIFFFSNLFRFYFSTFPWVPGPLENVELDSNKIYSTAIKKYYSN
jgi:hypothetical protein